MNTAQAQAATAHAGGLQDEVSQGSLQIELEGSD